MDYRGQFPPNGYPTQQGAPAEPTWQSQEQQNAWARAAYAPRAGAGAGYPSNLDASAGGQHQMSGMGAYGAASALPQAPSATDSYDHLSAAALDLAVPSNTMNAYQMYAQQQAGHAIQAAYHHQHAGAAPAHPQDAHLYSGAGLHARRIASLPQRAPAQPLRLPSGDGQAAFEQVLDEVALGSGGLTFSPLGSPSAATQASSSTNPSARSTMSVMSPSVTEAPPAAPKGKAKAPKKAAASKKRKVTVEDDFDDDFDDDKDAGRGGNAAGGHRACKSCKQSKIRCVRGDGDGPCRKCKAGGLPCVVEERKPPRNPNKREYLLAQIREKDAIIETLLREKYNPFQATPLSVKSFRETAASANQSVSRWLAHLEDGASRPGVRFTAYREPRSPASDPGDDAATAEAEDADDRASARGKDSPLDDANPIAILEGLHVSNRRASVGDSNTETAVEDTDTVGPSNKAYFTRSVGPVAEEHSKSELILHGLLTESDVRELFNLYHEHLNTFLPVLDPKIHTPQETFSRCPTLFTVVCAVTCRFHPEKADIYPIAMHFAKNECANALMHGWKSVGLAQAFMLLAMYHNPARRWEEERPYVYAGLALRIAIDLNVHIAPAARPKNEREWREALNRTRLWMICFETDWVMAYHYGKPSGVKENLIIRKSDDFYLASEYNLVTDIGLCAYTDLLRTVSGFHVQAYSDPNSRTGLNKGLNFRQMCDEYDGKLDETEAKWRRRFEEYTAFDHDPVYKFRCALLPYAIEYSRLIIFSFAFQQAFECGMQPSDRPFLVKCMNAAKAVVTLFIEVCAPTGLMRYAPNGWSNFAAFACTFLLKLMRPEFATLMPKNEEEELVLLMQRLVRALGSDNAAIDDRHAPKLWARFLGDLIAKRRNTLVATAPPAPPPVAGPSQGAAPPLPTPPIQGYASDIMGGSSGYATNSRAYTGWPATSGLPPAPAGPSAARPEPMQPHGFNLGPGYYQPSSLMQVDEGNTLAAMDALSADAFWKDMMLPGFVWPDSPPSMAGSVTDTSPQGSSTEGGAYWPHPPQA